MSEEDKREAGSPARGGARTGAGRPKGSGIYSEVRSVRLRPDEAEHCRRKGGNRYLRGLIRADMTREEAPEGEDRPADVLPREHLNVRVVGRVPLENDPKDNVTRVEMKGSCGFPSPADDYASEEFNLNDFFVRKPHTTFVIEADGDSMIDAGISSGDILLVDSSKAEEWEVIPNTHEGIVTQEEFDIVQQLITSRRLPQNKGGFVNIFAGVIKCVDCGCALRAMNVHRRKRPEIIDCVQYSCNNYARNGRSECSAHNIEARDLFNAVLADINCFADMAVNDEKAVRAIEKRLTETDQSRAKALEKERKKLNKRLAELDRLFSSLYEDKVMERITERNFEMMSGKYQKEQLEIEARLKEVTETLNESYEKSRGIRDFLALIRNYQGLKELDATVINALIDKILVSEREKMADGTVKQEIKIYYKFIGFVDELHIIPTKRWAAMPAKNCTVCGVEYVPGSGASRYCPACAKKIRREKSNESKRRSREQKRIACMNCPQKMTD